MFYSNTMPISFYWKLTCAPYWWKACSFSNILTLGNSMIQLLQLQNWEPPRAVLFPYTHFFHSSYKHLYYVKF